MKNDQKSNPSKTTTERSQFSMRNPDHTPQIIYSPDSSMESPREIGSGKYQNESLERRKELHAVSSQIQKELVRISASLDAVGTQITALISAIHAEYPELKDNTHLAAVHAVLAQEMQNIAQSPSADKQFLFYSEEAMQELVLQCEKSKSTLDKIETLQEHTRALLAEQSLLNTRLKEVAAQSAELENTYGDMLEVRDLLEVALEIERRDKMNNQGRQIYRWETPTPAEQDAGIWNCTTFVTRVIAEAGYNVEARHSVTVGEGQEQVTHDALMSDWFNNRAEESTPEQEAAGLKMEMLIPEVGQARASAKSYELSMLTQHEDVRIQGAHGAFIRTDLGAPVHEQNGLRPGDLLQWWNWKRDYLSSGHGVIVHRITGTFEGPSQTCVGPEGESYKQGDRITLDERWAPQQIFLGESSFEVIGSHFPIGLNGAGRGVTLYTKNARNLEETGKWYACRPYANRWAIFRLLFKANL